MWCFTSRALCQPQSSNGQKSIRLMFGRREPIKQNGTPATASHFYSACDSASRIGQYHRSREDENAAGPVVPGHFLVEKDRGQDDGDDHAELVNWRDLRSFAQLQGAEIA